MDNGKHTDSRKWILDMDKTLHQPRRSTERGRGLGQLHHSWEAKFGVKHNPPLISSLAASLVSEKEALKRSNTRPVPSVSEDRRGLERWRTLQQTSGNHQASGIFANHTLLLLLTTTTLVSPFLFLEKALSPPDFFTGDDSEPDDFRGGATADDNPYYSRQSTLMMATSSPRIGLRSSLIGSGDTCHVDPVKMSIRPPRRYAGLCAPTTQISYGCRGGCHSYSRMDARNATSVLRSCSCCRPTGFGFRLVRMRCEGFALRTTVKFALGCHCRPCMASVESVDTQRLRDLLRGTSIGKIG
ncbi:hypothetical protein ACOMHN_054325 [Nucella lapillus]